MQDLSKRPRQKVAWHRKIAGAGAAVLAAGAKKD